MATSDKLTDRLKGMLLETAVTNNSGVHKRQPLIQVVDSDEEGPKLSVDNNVVNEEEDDDECPPPISFSGAAAVSKTTESSTSINDNTSSVSMYAHTQSTNNNSSATQQQSLAEQLLIDAKIAKQRRQDEQMKKEHQRAKKSTFGMKKGFLNSNTSKKKVGKNNNTKLSSSHCQKVRQNAGVVAEKKKDEKDLIYELDNEGNMVPASQPTSYSSNKNHKPSSNDKDNPLHLPEVQSAMLSHLQTNSDQWATPDLLDTITQHHPKLARGMNDPRYMAALQRMQTNPKETLESLKETSPEIVDWLMEFCGVMGEHFIKLGGEESGGGSKDASVPGINSNAEKIREMGPLEKKALEKHQQDKGNNKQQNDDKGRHHSAANSKPDENMDSQVSSILANDELRSILLDPRMQQIMQECSTGSKLRYYMSHEEYGPKLRKLMEAGLIQVA